MTELTHYTYLHGLLGTNINWREHLEKSLGEKGDIFTPSIDYFQNPLDVRKYIKECVSVHLAKNNTGKHVLLANSVGCHFGMDVLDKFNQAFFISPTYNFSRGSISRNRQSIRSEVRHLFFDQQILNENANVLERESQYISRRLLERSSIRALKDLKKELVSENYLPMYARNAEKVHVILGQNDSLIPVDEYLGKHSKTMVSIDIITNCSHVAPVERPDELKKIINKYGA